MISTVITVFWLLIDTGSSSTSPVFLPQPFRSEQECTEGGEQFKESKVDVIESGAYVCIKQTIDTDP